MSRALVVVSSLFLLALAACPKGASSGSSVAAGALVVADRTQAADDLQPLYDANTPPVPVATAWCDALHDLPARNKRACCEAPADGGVLAPMGKSSIASTCAGELSAAMKQKDVAVDDKKVEACIAARSKQLEGCGWVSALVPALPPECEGAMTGSLDEGARCSSSLACKAGLRCQGASALDAGRCAKPAPDGARCGGGVDALAVVVPQAEIDRAHRECEGVCILGKCQQQPPDRKPAAALKERSPEGGACTNDFDCARGGCVNGVCGMKCTSWKDLQTH